MEERILRMLPKLNELQKRQFLANEAKLFGYGGVNVVSAVSGVSRTTKIRGISELENGETDSAEMRLSGGGLLSVELNDGKIVEKILAIVENSTYGDPMKVLCYFYHAKSAQNIGKTDKKGVNISLMTVGKILNANVYSKQSNQKVGQIGATHPGRNAAQV